MTAALLLLCLCPGADADTMPPLRNLDHFPPGWVAEENVRFGIAHVAWVRGQAGLEPENFAWVEWAWEAERCLLCWKTLAAASVEVDEADVDALASRQDALVTLRDLLGPDDYRAGRMPEWPWRRFRRVP